MENYVEATGKSISEAIEKALSELGVEENDVDIEILDEGKNGLLGILGSKTAKVRLTLKEKVQSAAVTFICDVLDQMEINADIEYSEDDEEIRIDVMGKDSGIIIGKRGETLDALQYLTSLAANRSSENFKRVILDIENYRAKRKKALEQLAHRLAERVVASGKSLMLEPMNPYERRVIHSTLQENDKVRTYSVGEEPNRKVVISTK